MLEHALRHVMHVVKKKVEPLNRQEKPLDLQHLAP